MADDAVAGESQKDGSDESEKASSASEAQQNPALAVATLLLIGGLLYGLFVYMPKVGDWMGDNIGNATDSPKPEDPEIAEVPAATRSASPEMTPELQPKQPAPIAKDEIIRQLQQQLDGDSPPEIGHVLFSDDATELLITLGDALEELTLIRDQFGRFVSEDGKIKIYPPEE